MCRAFSSVNNPGWVSARDTVPACEDEIRQSSPQGSNRILLSRCRDSEALDVWNVLNVLNGSAATIERSDAIILINQDHAQVHYVGQGRSRD